MNRLARHELYTGAYHTIPKTLGLIDHVTREDVVELCRSMISPEHMTAVAMGPLEPSLLRNVDWSVLQ
jgi:predicted Zn-dependent peptidase